MTAPPKMPREPFTPPFHYYETTDPYRDHYYICDTNGRLVRAALDEDAAKWLRDRLNATHSRAGGEIRRLLSPLHYSGRNIIDAARRLANANAEEVQTIAAHDWDMIREVAAVYLAEKRAALFADKPNGSCHGR